MSRQKETLQERLRFTAQMGIPDFTNCVHNEIMASIEVSDEGHIVSRIDTRKAFRRKVKGLYRELRKAEKA
jgi:hypothetical protein